jgi:hypothetical protein
MVWEEVPSALRFSPQALRRTQAVLTEAVARDRSHPSIVAWVLYNESWGVPEVGRDRAQRAAVQAMASLATALDPSRLVVADDGWEGVGGDLLGVHDYDTPERLVKRWQPEARRRSLSQYGDHGHRHCLDATAPDDRPLVLSEFGGLSLASSPGWGYQNAIADAATFAERYEALLAAVAAIDGLAGYCYTQLTDTYQETNGLLTVDRIPKVAIERIWAATRLPVGSPVETVEAWTRASLAVAGEEREAVGHGDVSAEADVAAPDPATALTVIDHLLLVGRVAPDAVGPGFQQAGERGPQGERD